MANHFFAINRGLSGMREDEIVKATSTTSAADFEFRIADVDGQSVAMTRLDAVKALDAIRRALVGPSVTTFPPL